MPAWLINLAWGALFSFISFLLSPKPQSRNAQADDVTVPRSEEGAEIGKVYGTVWIRNPQFADYGDFVKTPIVETGPRRYGIVGPRSSTTIGFEYYFGALIVLCQAPIDGISNISFEDREAWSGFVNDGQISIYKPTLFGDRRREGGVQGFVDVENGAADQPINSYISTYLRPGELVSAHRGVFALVPKRMYWGNSAFIQALRIKTHNVYSTYRRWFPAVAPINAEFRFENCAIQIGLDCSTSMAGTKFTNQIAEIKSFVSSLQGFPGVSVRIQPFGTNSFGSIERYDVDAADVTAINAFLDTLTATASNTNIDIALTGAETFWNTAQSNLAEDVSAATFLSAASGGSENIGLATTQSSFRRVLVILSDGAPTGTTGDDLVADIAALSVTPEVFCFLLDAITIYLGSGGGGGSISLPSGLDPLEEIDNTPADGVPIIDADEPGAIQRAVSGAFNQFIDINPAHILRDMLIAPSSDGDGDETVIGDSFSEAAYTLYGEGLGVSLFWQNPSNKDEFRNLVEQHISGKVYFDQVSGQWELKLIRNDYTVGALHTFDSSNIVEWTEEFQRPQQAELPNSITLVYSKRTNGEPASVTVHNVAAVAQTGRVINEKVELRGITWPPLANKIAQRELLARTIPLAKGAIRVAYAPADLTLASAFVLNDPRVGAENVVCRVVEIEEADGRDNSILIRFVEDVFNADLTEDAFASGDDGAVTVQTAQPSDVIFFEELSYFEQVQGRDALGIDDLLTVDPGFGNWHITGNAPTPQHFSADIVRYDYPNWVSVGSSGLMPVWTLSADLSRAANVTTFTTPVTGREAEIAIGQLIQIDHERMRVDSISIAGTTATWTVGRGCLDTVPASHVSGSYLMAWPGITGTDGVDYTDGDALTVRFLTETAQQSLPLASATNQTLTLASRAFRPLPVGQLQMGGAYSPASSQSGTVTVTWVHRDRLDQASEPILDHTDAGIGPEAGVSYHLVRRLIDSISGVESVSYTLEEPISPPQATTIDVDVDDAAFSAYAGADTVAMEIGILTKRGTSPSEYENWQTPFIRFETSFASAPGSASPSPSVPAVTAFAFAASPSTAQTIPSATTTEIDFGTEESDTAAAFAANRFTVPASLDGTYAEFTLFVEASGTSSQDTTIFIEKSTNGGSTWTEVIRSGIIDTRNTAMSGLVLLATGDIYRATINFPSTGYDVLTTSRFSGRTTVVV